jgi:hypothetical protein
MSFIGAFGAVPARRAKMLNVCNCFSSGGASEIFSAGKCLFTEQTSGAKTIKPQKK